MISTEVDKFFADMRADPRFADVAEGMAQALSAIDIEGDGNAHAIVCMQAIEWIMAQPRTLDEKIEALHKLSSIRGKVSIPCMRAWAGW
jgi:hypothetical protein